MFLRKAQIESLANVNFSSEMLQSNNFLSASVQTGSALFSLPQILKRTWINLYQLAGFAYQFDALFLFSFQLTLEKKRRIHEARVSFNILEEILRELKVSGKKTQHLYLLLAVKTITVHLKYRHVRLQTVDTFQSPRSTIIPLCGEKTTQQQFSLESSHFCLHKLAASQRNSKHGAPTERPESRSVSKHGSDLVS